MVENVLTLLRPAMLVFAAASLAAQTTHNVGPGGHPQISDAIAAAQPGDLILVQQGSYLPFDLTIGVCILAPAGATVTTPPGGGGLPWVHPIQPPAGQHAQIVGLTFVTNSAYPPAEPPVTVHATGNVVFADCVFRNWSDYTSNAVICNGDVQFDRCQWLGVWDCLLVQGGRVVANSCSFSPSRVIWAGWDTKCIVASGGELRLNFCTLHGSDANGQPSSIGSTAIQLSGTASLTVADCSITGGNSITTPSIGITNNTTTPVRHARSLILGGTGVLSHVPTQVGPGPGFSGPEQSTLLVGGGGSAAGPRLGSQYLCSVVGPANSITLLVLSLERAPATTLPLIAGPVHFDPTDAFVLAAGVTNDYSGWPGNAACIWSTVTLTAPMLGRQFWLHSLLWDGALFQVGPTCGGVVY